MIEESLPSDKQEKFEGPAIHDLHADERPREKAIRNGFSSLTVPELFALILRTGTKGFNVVDICRELMRRNDNSLHLLQRRSIEEIMNIRGLGESKAVQVMATMELVRRFARETVPENPQILTSRDFFNVMAPEIGNLPHEEIWAGLLNRHNKLTNKVLMSRGGYTASVADLKMILKAALLENAQSIILIHNHPSGNIRPSTADDSITSKIFEACKILEINLLDHLIVTSDRYFSYRDEARKPFS